MVLYEGWGAPSSRGVIWFKCLTSIVSLLSISVEYVIFKANILCKVCSVNKRTDFNYSPEFACEIETRKIHDVSIVRVEQSNRKVAKFKITFCCSVVGRIPAVSKALAQKVLLRTSGFPVIEVIKWKCVFSVRCHWFIVSFARSLRQKYVHGIC